MDSPVVTYTGEISLTRDNVEVIAGRSVTFPSPGDHVITAAANTVEGQVITSAPVTIHVVAAVGPAFTVTAPAAGTVVPLREGGGQVDVRVAIPADQYFPVTVAIARDGQAFSAETISSTSYQLTVPLGPMPLGPRTIAVNVSDRDGLNSTKTVTVTGRDVAPPDLRIDDPLPSANIIGDVNGTVTVRMRGGAADNQSGMVGGQASVAWALAPTGTRTAAVPRAAGDFTAWTADVPMTGFGAHTIYLWATDQAGNGTPADAPEVVPVVVISSFVPSTLDERLNERQYLAALLSFAQEQVTLPGNPRPQLDTATLVAALGQPVDRLSQPLSAAADRGGQEINQLRVPIELLRAHIAATHTATEPGAAMEASYRDAAYTSLLASYGTSYSRLRQVRGATPAARQALAAELGIRLSPKTPDELDQLTLEGGRLSETTLETLFGLPASTGTDPLRAPPIPLLRTWQLAAQALTWAEQDQRPNPPRKFPVLLDPDLIGAPDVVPGPKGDPVRALLTRRAGELRSFANSLEKARVAAATPAAGLAVMLTMALPGVDLADLAAKDQRGVDIGAALSSAGLTRGGFLFLVGLGRIVAGAAATQLEWADANAILTAAHKPSMYAAWRTQETAYVLSPDFFVLADTPPQANAYRADARARAAWQKVLRSRIAQRQDLIAATGRAVAAAEQTALPILRDALLTDLAPTTTGDIGEEMSARFSVDVLAGGTLRTTRIRQALESVQSLLLAKRSGELTATHPAFAWMLKDPVAFTAAWVWMGELGSWQAATMAFLFAERHLDPALPAAFVPHVTSGQPKPLDTLRANIRGSGPFSAADAVREGNVYLQAIGMAAVTYLDPNGRTAGHQDALRAVSASRPEPGNREIFWAVPLLLAQRLQSAGDFQAALDWYWIVYPYDLESTLSIYQRIATETSFRPNLTFRPGWTVRAKLDPFALVGDTIAPRPAPYTRYTLLCVIRCHIDYADAEFSRETDESVANARTLYVTARRLLGVAKLQPLEPTNFGEPKLAIPELASLRARVTVQLTKLRQGRNIAGMPRTQGLSTKVTVSQPTPFRFKTLIERARQLAGQAAQMEAGYLAALEKYDEKSLRQFDALKGIELSVAQVGLAASRVKEANDAATAAVAQRTKAETMVTTYGAAIDAPPNKYEQDLLDEFQVMRDIRDDIANENATIGIAQAAASAASITDEIFSGGAAAAAAAVTAGATILKRFSEQHQNKVEAQMQANQLQAGLAQRRDEWRLQQAAAQQETLVAAAQVDVANDQVTIATQEQAIATLQRDQAVATLKFLNSQFTNADLYLWMSYTLGGVYRYFLQQATATARLAQAQLAFERAEPAQVLIRDDYWQSPAPAAGGTSQLDRRGLTGAEQLSEDLTRLDQYAFSSERRRLNLSQTFSLARLMPVEFLEFRRTGTLAFATPMALFDRDFPGHYLRMIRQVRTSLVALVPPDRGIRATLYSNGISRVTSGRDGVFEDITVRHDPGIVALTSPVSASGVFELDVQSDMLLPFESSGVDTTWELQLPRAANPFDFSSIVDALITIDYTALYDDGYRNQVTTRLNADRERGADCVFSLARDFPDQWYDLNNPLNSTTRSVTITLRDVDFPATIEDLSTTSIAVRLAGDDPIPDTVVSLHRGPFGGDATATNGIASTRRGNAAAWNALCGTSPTGDWQLNFGADAAALFSSGGLDDLLLVVSWAGQAPAWEV